MDTFEYPTCLRKELCCGLANGWCCSIKCFFYWKEKKGRLKLGIY